MGSVLPDAVRQQFDDEIKAGKILVLVDATDETQVPAVMDAMEYARATRLHYASPMGAK